MLENRLVRLERAFALQFDLDFSLLNQVLHMSSLLLTAVLKMGFGLNRLFVTPGNDGDMLLSVLLYPTSCPAFLIDFAHAPLTIGRRFLPRICGYPLLLLELLRRYTLGEWLSYWLMDTLGMTPFAASVIGILGAEILTNDLTAYVVPFALVLAIIYPDQEVHVGYPMFLLSMVLTHGAERLGMRDRFAVPRFSKSPMMRQAAYVTAAYTAWGIQLGFVPMPNYLAAVDKLGANMLTPQVWYADASSPVRDQARRAAAGGRRPVQPA